MYKRRHHSSLSLHPIVFARFVEFGMVREAEQALQKLNGFDMGNNVRLCVKVAERQEDRQKRLAKKREDEAFLSTLYCGKRGGKDPSCVAEYEMDDEEAENLKNPFLPQYTSPHHSDMTSHSSTSQHANMSPGPSSLTSSGGAASLSAPAGMCSNGSTQEKEDLSTSPGSDEPQKVVHERKSLCIVCKKMTAVKCAQCRAPYCSKICQTEDWPQHKKICSQSGGGQNSKSDRGLSSDESSGVLPSFQGDMNEPLKIAENSEDEGFDISIPGDDEIAAIKHYVEQVQLGNPPSVVNQHEYGRSSGSTGSGGQDGGAKKGASLSSPVTQKKSLLTSLTQPQMEECDVPTATTKHVTFGPSLQPAPSNPAHSNPTPSNPAPSNPAPSNPAPSNPAPSNPAHSNPTPSNPAPSNPAEGIMVPFSKVMSHFTSSSNLLLSIPLDSPLPEEFNAVVTAVLSCTKFSINALSVETKQALAQLQAFGEQGPFVPVNPAEITIGSKCGFRSESGEFYRVEVIKKHQDELILVRRYDLGGHMTLPAKSLCRLPEEIILIPCIRHRCSLLNLFSEEGVGVELFVRLVGGKPVHVEHHGKMPLKNNPKETFSLCKIQSMDKEVDIYEVLSSSQLVQRKQVRANVTNLIPESLGSATSARGPEEIVQEEPKEMADPRECPASSEGQYRIVHFAHKIPTHQPPSEGVFEMIPTIVTSPAVIWAHVAHPHLGVLTRMEKDLNLHYRCCKDDSYAPTVGEICVAKFPEDQQFYRAEVLCVNHNGTVDVFYVDFGNRATMTTGQLRYLEPIFLTLPKQAVQFSLAGITPSGSTQHWSDNAVAYLKGKITRNCVRVEIVSATQTSFLVKMFDPDAPNKVLNDAMVALGHAQLGQGKSPSTPLFSLRGVSLGQRRSSGFGNLSPVSPHGTVTTSFRNSPHADETFVFGQTATSFVKSEPQPVTPPTSPPSPTKMIGPPLKRSPLLNKSSPFSTDSQTTQMTTAMGQASSPRQARGSPGKRPPWRSMKRQSSGEPEEEKESPSARAPNVALQEPTLMKQTSQSRRESGREKSPPQVSGLGLGPDQTSPQKRRGSSGRRDECVFTRQKIETAQLPLNESVHAMVTHVESPLEFWVQVAEQGSSKSLMSLLTKLNSIQVTPYTNPQAGELCVCRYAEDNFLYRGKVVMANEDNQRNIQFIDYGNTEVVQLSAIFQIPEQFLALPGQAIFCTLNQLLNPAGRNCPWAKGAIEFFKSRVMGEETFVNVTLVKTVGEKNIVDITVDTDSGGKDLLEMMVKNGYGASFKKTKPPNMGAGGKAGSGTQQRSPFGGNFKGRSEQCDVQQKSPFSGTSTGGSEQLSTAADQSQGKARVPFASLITAHQKPSETKLGSTKMPVLSRELSTVHQQTYPRVAEMERCQVPTKSNYFEILVTEVENPHSLFAQVATMAFAQRLEELTVGIRTHFQSAPPSSLPHPPKEGSLCCAKFYQDGAWYRAEVMEASETGCKVRFIDFGNTESVKLCDLAPCPAHFQATPIMTIHCALNGVAPPKPGSVWSPAATSFLKQKSFDRVLQARVTNSSRDIPEIELVDTSSDVDVNIAEELITRGHAITSSSAPTHTENEPGKLSRATPQLNLSAIQSEEVKLSCDRATASVVPPTRLPEGTLFKIQVTDVTDPWSFSIQEMDRENLAALNTLMLDLQEAYRDPSPYDSFQVQVGALCCARYDADECWYRCQVLEDVGGNRVKLRYIDFGNVECISVNKVYSLDNKFTQLPSAAVLCSLNAVKPVSQAGWSSEAVQVFKDLVMGGSGNINIISARVVSKNTSGITNIDLFADDGGRNSVADILVKTQFASAPMQTPGTAMSVSPPPSAPVPSNEHSFCDQQPSHETLQVPPSTCILPSVALPTSPEFTVMVPHVDSPSLFYVQVITEEGVHSMLALMENLNAYCTSATGFQQAPTTGEFCAAKYDREWFRAQVLRQISPNMLEVFFIDFGNTETVPLSTVKPLLQKHLSLPMQAVACGLYGVPAREAISPTDTSQEMFKSLVLNGKFSCKIICKYPLLVDLKNTAATTSLSVRDELTKMGLFPRVQDLGLSLLSPNCLPSTNSSVVMVTEICDPSDFWIQVGDLSTLRELEMISQKMNEYCESSPQCRELPVLGQLCCARFSEDGMWYRARVVEFFTKMSFRVHFVDYGNGEVVNVSSVRPFKRDFMHVPSQGIHCCLIGFERSVGGGGGGGKSSGAGAAAAQFKGMVENRHLIAIHRGVSGEDKAVVELVDTSSDTDVYIHQQLKGGH